MSKMIKVDVINLDNPEIGFHGEVKSEGFQERVSSGKSIVLHMQTGNQMIITPTMQQRYVFVVLCKDEIKRREEAAKEG